MDRWRWLASQKFCQFILSRNADHACNYATAKQWIEEISPESFTKTPPDELQRMKDSDTIWQLQIYPDTPVGCFVWNGSTAEYVIDAAMDHFKAAPAVSLDQRIADLEAERAALMSENAALKG